jgi:hypothetical protein
MRNTVVEFVENRQIAWQNFGRRIWRYELQPLSVGDNGQVDRTLVRESFDYANDGNAAQPRATLRPLNRNQICQRHPYSAVDHHFEDQPHPGRPRNAKKAVDLKAHPARRSHHPPMCCLLLESSQS